jgi:hypothetical protein
MPATASDVARWMLDRFSTETLLYQQTTAYDIKERFGERFVYTNSSGNLAISKEVLAKFRKISKDTVVWVRGQKYWRARQETDKPGRKQDG